ncbi:ubiquinol-cytochrome C reductase complex 7.8 kDa family protein [Populus alba x Populus x berolinensis]|uniref:Complex III subunit VI n=1 Tax=Populus alba x Populus x berolinensis TaxID=444605 RepID=A0AAD6W4R9_9ROSI|nr:ubiquinol-cytochrome C reductase complex 7.8 kDa family protein [Populus alba x Populus x berolinensis]
MNKSSRRACFLSICASEANVCTSFIPRCGLAFDMRTKTLKSLSFNHPPVSQSCANNKDCTWVLVSISSALSRVASIKSKSQRTSSRFACVNHPVFVSPTPNQGEVEKGRFVSLLFKVLCLRAMNQDHGAVFLTSGMADEEPVDPKKYLEEACKPKCVRPLLEYQACVKRIQGDESGHKHCTGQYFDYWSCVDKCACVKRVEGDDTSQKHCTGQYFDYWFCIDKCVAPKLLSKLK